MRRSPRRERGFTLVEALVALGLAAVAAAGLAAAASTTARHLGRARERSIALSLAADRLEMLRAGPRDDGREEIRVAGADFVRTWDAAGGRGSPVRLHVEVEWPDGSVRLESAVFP